MALVQDDHVVQTLAADAPDQPFDIGVLPGAPWGDQYFLDAHVADSPPKRRAIDPVPIAQEIPWCVVPREGVDHLLGGPRRGGVFRDMEMDETSSLMGQGE